MLVGGGSASIPALATASFGDVTRFVFVPSAVEATATVVDVDSNQIAGSIQLGIVPRQALISRTEAQLIVTDARSPEFVTIDLASHAASRVSLPHAAERLVLGVNGWVLAAADATQGAITFFDLRRRVVMGTISGLPPLNDLMFVDQDAYLFVAAEGWTNIAVIDVNTRRLVRRVGRAGLGKGDIVALARTPNGRSVLARPAGDGPPSVIDVETGQAVAELGKTAARDGIVPSGTGAFLFVPDNQEAAVRVYHEGQFSSAVMLSATSGMGAVYSAWLDSVAFVACAPRRELLVYDLDKLRPAGSLELEGVPGQGGVTPDSRKLYVPLTSPAGLAVIDCQTRTIAATLPMPSAPLAAVVPGGWGLCH